MPNKYIPKLGSTRGRWKAEDLKHAFEAVKSGASVRKASAMFSIPRKTLERRVKQDNVTKGPMGPGSCFGKDNEERLVRHIKKMQMNGFPLTRDDVRSLAYNFATQLGIQHRFNNNNEKAGYDWLQLFLSRHPDISVRKSEGVSLARVQGMDRSEVAEYFSLLKNILEENELINKPSALFNMDETGLQLNNRPGQVLAEKGSKVVHTITSGEKGETITVIACCNAEGMFLPPVSIMKGKNKKQEWEDNMPPGSVVMMSEKSAYVNTAIFLNWLKNHFFPRKPAGKVLLIMDGHASHCNSVEVLEFADENDIILLCLPSHTTHYLQPLDRAVFKSVKHYFYTACAKWLTNHPNRKLTRIQFGELLSETWGKAATPENAIAGFRATGIYPFNAYAIPDYAFVVNARPRENENHEPAPHILLTANVEEPDRTRNSGVSNEDTERNLLSSASNMEIGLQIGASPTSPEEPGTSRKNAEKNSFSAAVDRLKTTNDTDPSPSTSVAEAISPTKVLTNISPIPETTKQTPKRKKLKATLLTSPENIAQLKTKRENANKKFLGKQKKAVPMLASKKRRVLRPVRDTPTSSSSSSEAEVPLQDDSCDDFDQDEEECVGCGEDYNLTILKCDWIKCVRCHRWLHENCTNFTDVCNRCGKAITKK